MTHLTWGNSVRSRLRTPAPAGTGPGRGRLVGVDVSKATCTAAACDRPAKSRGLCIKHYHRLRRTGSTELVERIVWEPITAVVPLPAAFGSSPLPERIWVRTRVIEYGCWEWTGDKDRGGYGRTSVGRREVAKTRLLHRLAYVSFIGPIPDGMFLDHYRYPDQCIGPACFRPDHVRPVTTRENVLRADTEPAWNLAKTHCVRGHPLAGSNLYINPNSRNRQCVTCKRASLRAWRARKAAENKRAS